MTQSHLIADVIFLSVYFPCFSFSLNSLLRIVSLDNHKVKKISMQQSYRKSKWYRQDKFYFGHGWRRRRFQRTRGLSKWYWRLTNWEKDIRRVLFSNKFSFILVFLPWLAWYHWLHMFFNLRVHTFKINEKWTFTFCLTLLLSSNLLLHAISQVFLLIWRQDNITIYNPFWHVNNVIHNSFTRCRK